MAISLQVAGSNSNFAGANQTAVTVTNTTTTTMCVCVITYDTGYTSIANTGLTWNLLYTGNQYAVFVGWRTTAAAFTTTVTFGTGVNVRQTVSVSCWSGCQNYTPYSAFKSTTLNYIVAKAAYANSVMMCVGNTNSTAVNTFQTGCTNAGGLRNITPAWSAISCYYSSAVTAVDTSYTVGLSSTTGSIRECTNIELIDAATVIFPIIPGGANIGTPIALGSGTVQSIGAAFSHLGSAATSLGSFYRSSTDPTQYVYSTNGSSPDFVQVVSSSGQPISFRQFYGTQRGH